LKAASHALSNYAMTECYSTFNGASTESAHTLNDLGGSTASPVALQSSVSISSLPQQVTQLLTGLQLVLLLAKTGQH